MEDVFRERLSDGLSSIEKAADHKKQWHMKSENQMPDWPIRNDAAMAYYYKENCYSLCNVHGDIPIQRTNMVGTAHHACFLLGVAIKKA